MPVNPDLLPFTTTAAGKWTLSAGVPVGLVGELFGQAAIFDGPNLVVSNPLHAHVQ